jgi:hypothetical protein
VLSNIIIIFDLNMNNSYIDQITLDCLINKEMMGKHVMKQREKQIDKDEYNFYRKRIFNLFKDLISNKIPDDLPPDVKYAYDTFIKGAIHYFKVADNNDLLQQEYKDVDIPLHICSSLETDLSENIVVHNEANKLLMRSVKMDLPTLDKYVKRTSHKKKEEVILPKPREVDIMNPELKNKGLKKNNINSLYEDDKKEEIKKSNI